MTRYANADTSTRASRHQVYGWVTTANTHNTATNSVISADVDAWICSVVLASHDSRGDDQAGRDQSD